MTVASETSRVTAVGITAGVGVGVSFPIFAVEDVTVYYGADIVADLGTHYTVTLDPPDFLSATITPTQALVDESGGTITIARRVAFVQTLDIPTNNRIPERGLVRALDYFVFMAQQVRDDLLRVLKFPASDTDTNMSALPSATDRANKYFKFDADGKPTAVSVLSVGAVAFSAFSEGLMALVSAAAWRAGLFVPGLNVANVFTALNTFQNAIDEKKWTDIASAATTDLGAANGNYGDVTGNATINSLGNGIAGQRRHARFTGTPTLAHSANLRLPGAANIVAAVGDAALFYCRSTGVWECLNFTKANGTAVVVVASGWQTLASQAVSGTDFTLDGIPSTYNWLRIKLDFFPVSNNVGLEMLARKGAGSNITSYHKQSLASAAAVSTPSEVMGAALMNFFNATQNSVPNGGVNARIEIDNIQSGRNKRMMVRVAAFDATSQFILEHSFTIIDTNPITGFLLHFNAGNIAANNGRILVEACA